MVSPTEADLKREVARGVLPKAAMAVSRFVGGVVFARLLGPELFGGVVLVMAITRYVDRPMIGWAIAAKKRISERETNRRNCLGTQLLVTIVWISGVSICAFALAEPLQAVTGLNHAPFYLILLLSTESVFESILLLLQGLGYISKAEIVNAIRTFTELISRAALIVMGFGALGYVLGSGVAFVAVLPLVVGLLPTLPRFPSREAIESHWSFARYSIPSATLGSAFDQLDILLLGILLTPAHSGYYEAAWKLAFPAMLLPEMVGEGLMAKISSLAGRREEMVVELEETLRYSSVLAFPLFFGAITMSTDILNAFYGAAYVQGAELLVGLALFQVIRSQSLPLLQSIHGLDEPRVEMVLSAIAIAINLIVGSLLTVTIGPIGVVISTILAETVRYAGAYLYLRNVFDDLTLIPVELLEQSVAGVAMACFVFALQQFFSLRTLPLVLSTIGVGGCIYVVLIVEFNAELRRSLAGMVSDLR